MNFGPLAPSVSPCRVTRDAGGVPITPYLHNPCLAARLPALPALSDGKGRLSTDSQASQSATQRGTWEEAPFHFSIRWFARL